MKYNDILKINETFQYSINLQFDINNIEKIKQYIPTKDSCEVMEYYIDGIEGNFSKSTTLIGPYGKGKSHLLLVLLMLLNDYNKEDEKVFNNLLGKIEKVNHNLYEKLLNIRTKQKKYMPIIINSNYNNMNQAFLLALSEAIERENLDGLIVDTYFSAALNVLKKWEEEGYEDAIQKFKQCLKDENTDLNELKRMLREFDEEGYKIFQKIYSCVMHGMEFNPLINSDIIKYYKDINYKICQKGYNGMVIVFDEFSKFLESVDNENMMRDLKILQDFAELANRTGKKEQILLSCITHKTINEYIKNLKNDKVNAFKTVEGRFKEIYFNRSIQQNFEIISQTIEKKQGFEAHFDQFYNENIDLYNEVEMLDFAKIENVQDILFKGCYPLNPMTVYFLIYLSEKIAQNERTLFTFLTDDDTFSFKNFTRNYETGLFNVDKIYDYFEMILRKENDENIKKVWLKSQNALNKVATEIEMKILKCIAIINILNDETLIVSNNKHIALCLNEDIEKIEKIVKSLLERGIIKLKKTTKTYDFASSFNKKTTNDIEKIVEEKFSSINERQVLENVIDLGYVIPRRYNQEYKMTRFFQNIFMTGEEIIALNNFDILFKKYFSDGFIINLIKKDDNIEEIKEKIDLINDNRIILKIPNNSIDDEFIRTLKEYNAIQYLKRSDQEEEIIKEIELIEDETKELLQKKVEKYFSKKGIKEYYYLGEARVNVKNLSTYVSDICENVYNLTPIVNNEMINKEKVTAPIYKARNIVIDSIIKQDKSLIKSQTSAEATIYKAIVLKEKEEAIANVINIIREYIQSAENRKSFEEIYNLLCKKPYGIRKGILPILTVLAFREFNENIILYFQTREIEVNPENISKIIDSPEKYYIMLEPGTKEKIEYVNSLLNIFNIPTTKNQRVDIKNLIDEMRRWILSLPRIIRELNNPDKLVQEISYIKFKNELLKSDINNYEFIFRKLKEIFETEDFAKISNEIKKVKEIFDNYLELYSQKVIEDTKELFEHNSKTNLNNILKKWYSQIDEKIKHTVFSIEVKRLFDFIENMKTYNETEIIENISYIMLGYYIQDWQENSRDMYLEKFRKVLQDISSYECSDQAEETITILDGETEIKKYINDVKISQLGETLKNNIEDTLEEYGEAINESEKIKILLQIIKKYM